MQKKQKKLIKHLLHTALISLLLSIALPVLSQTEPDTTNTELERAKNRIDQFLDVDFARHALQARRKSSVGTVFASNKKLRDSIAGFRDTAKVDIFVRSYIDTNHFWAGIFKRAQYQRKLSAINQDPDTVYIDFDMVYKPVGEEGYALTITNAPKDTTVLSELKSDTLHTTVNRTLTNIYKQPKDADANTAMYNGMGYLLQEFAPDSTSLKIPVLVSFAKKTNQDYGFDWSHNVGMEHMYSKIKYGAINYTQTYKSIEINKTDVVKYSVEIKESGFDKSNIKFKDVNGRNLASTLIDNDTYTLTINSGIVDEVDVIKAIAIQTDSKGNEIETEIGSLNLKTYDNDPQNIIIIPLQGHVSPITAVNIENGLNAIYRQAVISFNVELQASLLISDIDWEEDTPDGKVEFGTSKALSCYTKEQQNIIKHYKRNVGKLDKDKHYVFLCGSSSKAGVMGFNPKQKSVSFLFLDQIANNQTFIHVLAHELGHGLFNQIHTKKYFPMSEKGKTDNLMDYAGTTANHLHHEQWDLIHDPIRMWMPWLEDDEDGAYIIDRWKLVRQYIDEFNGKTGTARTNYKFTYDNSKVAENFSTEAINQVNNLLTEYLKENDEPVFVVLELFTHTEEKDVTEIKSIVEQECLDILKKYPNTVLIPIIGCQLVNEGNAPIRDVEFYICKKVSEQKNSQIGNYDDNWADLEKENVSDEVINFLELLQSSPVFSDDNCLELTYEELGISSASELNPNDVKQWVSEFAGDNGVSIDYSYTGYPTVTNSEIPTASLNQPENSNTDINIAVHFDENGKKIIIYHHYKAGAIVIPSVTASGEPVQETTVDEIVGLSKVYAGKALDYAKTGGEKMQALFNYAVKGVVAAKTWTKTICDKMEVPEQTWNQSSGNFEAYKRSPVNVEPLMAGVGDGTFEEIKSIPELITLALDVAFDKEIRTSLWQSLTSLSWEDIKNLPIKMIRDKIDIYKNSHASVVKHEAGKDGVAIASMFFGFGSAKKAKELAETVGKNSTDYAKALQKVYNKFDVSKIDEFGVKLDNLGSDITGVKLKKIGNTNHTTIAKIDVDGNLSFVESEHVFEAVYEIEKKGGAKGYCVLDKADDGKTVFREISEDVAKVAHHLKTEPNKAFFWSGITNGIGGKNIALDIAESKGGITLEGLLKKKGLDLPEWDINNPVTVKLWEDVSAQYSKQVTGEVRAVVGKTLREGNIWETIELKRLKANLKVTKITTIDPETLV
ncbi:MAG: hypothetical protein IMY72_11165 [Bacteroidetes bacterium]|nr:hypothetical protein [Bacteroidota bacterium]